MLRCTNQWIRLRKLTKQCRPGERVCQVVVPKRPVCTAHKLHSLPAQCIRVFCVGAVQRCGLVTGLPSGGPGSDRQTWHICRGLTHFPQADSGFMPQVSEAVPWLRRSVAGLSPRRPGLGPRPVCVRFDVHKVALSPVYLQYCGCPPSVSSYQSTHLSLRQ